MEVSPEFVVHEAIDERIQTAVGHAEPMRDKIGDNKIGVLAGLVFHVLSYFRVKEDDHTEGLQWQPGNYEHDDDHKKHLDHLEEMSPCSLGGEPDWPIRLDRVCSNLCIWYRPIKNSPLLVSPVHSCPYLRLHFLASYYAIG